MNEAALPTDIAALTVRLLSAYLANNIVPSQDLAGLIRSTRNALSVDAAPSVQAQSETSSPAVSVRKSLASADHIISLIDGRPYKTLKRHLARHGLTPDDYRSRYNLPATYPMVAQSYAEHRRSIAEKTGLGTRRSADEGGALPQSEEPAGAASAVVTAAGSQATSDAREVQDGAARSEESKAALSSDIAVSEQVSPGEPAQAPAAKPSVSTQIDTDTIFDTALAPSPRKRPVAKPTRDKAKRAVSKSTATAAAGSKNRVGKPKVSDAAKQVPVESTSELADKAAYSQDVQPDAQKPKRRAKLGLFTSARAEAVAPDDEAAGRPADTPTSGEQPESSRIAEAGGKAPAKGKTSKRMARAPHASAELQGKAADHSSDPSVQR